MLNKSGSNMKKRKMFVSAVIVAMGLLGAKSVYGIGIGAYVKNSRGSADFEDASSGGTSSVDTKSSGVAFVFDTNVSKRKIFNYRGAIEIDAIKYNQVTLDKYSLVHDFGFRVFNNEYVLVWVGPEVSFSIQNGSSGGDWSGGGVDAGAVVGINVYLDKSVSFIVKGGAVYSSYTLDREDEFRNINTYYVDGSSTFLNFGLIVRFNEL